MLFLLFKSKNKFDVKAEKPYSSCSSLDSSLLDCFPMSEEGEGRGKRKNLAVSCAAC